jgi:hypothetical protein
MFRFGALSALRYLGYLTQARTIGDSQIVVAVAPPRLRVRSGESQADAASLGPVDEQKKQAVWSKGHIIQGYDPAVYRHDDFGRTIRYADFRDPSQYGWGDWIAES